MIAIREWHSTVEAGFVAVWPHELHTNRGLTAKRRASRIPFFKALVGLSRCSSQAWTGSAGHGSSCGVARWICAVKVPVEPVDAPGLRVGQIQACVVSVAGPGALGPVEEQPWFTSDLFNQLIRQVPNEPFNDQTDCFMNQRMG